MPSGSAALLSNAVFQEIRYDHRSGKEFQREVVAAACAVVGADPARVRRLSSSRNADLYRIGAADGEWLLKILVSKPAATLEREYRHLQDLHALAESTGTFRVPRPRAFLADRSAYLMQFVAGETLASRMLDPADAASPAFLDETARRCGVALAAIHRAWSDGAAPFDAGALAADLTHLPWKPGAHEARVLSAAGRRLDGAVLHRSRLYLDFDPVNVCCAHDGSLVLLDPPERDALDAAAWDLGIFLVGLDRAGWRRPTALGRVASRAPGMRRAFLEGYALESGVPPEGGEALIVALAEYSRVGQLWRWWSKPLGFRHRIVGVVRAAYARPLLLAARRRAIRTIEREVGR